MKLSRFVKKPFPNVTAGLGLRGNESFPDLVRIGSEGKSNLYSEMRALSA